MVTSSAVNDFRFMIFNGLLRGATINLEYLFLNHIAYIQSNQDYQEDDPLGIFWEQSTCMFYIAPIPANSYLTISFDFSTEEFGTNEAHIFLGLQFIDTVTVFGGIINHSPLYIIFGDGETPLYFILRGARVGIPLFVHPITWEVREY